MCFIIVENAIKVKSHEYDNWYREYLTGEDGIWVGNGIDDQYIINLNSSKRLVNTCGQSFGYAVISGQEYLVKLLGIKDNRDEED